MRRRRKKREQGERWEVTASSSPLVLHLGRRGNFSPTPLSTARYGLVVYYCTKGAGRKGAVTASSSPMVLPLGKEETVLQHPSAQPGTDSVPIVGITRFVYCRQYRSMKHSSCLPLCTMLWMPLSCYQHERQVLFKLCISFMLRDITLLSRF